MSSSDDTFQAFAEFASRPRTLPVDSSSSTSSSSNNNSSKDQSSSNKSSKPFGNLFHGLHISHLRQLSSQSSTSSTTETLESEPDATSGASTCSDDGRKLFRRGSFILSSGADKYTFDSETIDMPHRAIDSYEKRLRADPPVVPRRTLLQPGNQNRLTTRSLTHFSSRSEDSSDKSSSFKSENSDRTERTSASVSPSSPPGSTRRPFGKERKMQRGSLVRSARLELSRSVLSNGRYSNPWDTWTPLRFTNILKFGFTKDKSNIPPKEQLDIVLPIVNPVFSTPMPPDTMAITWLGHATVVVQMDSVSFITDPIFSDRASPSQMVGPKRYRDPPCTVHDLPADLDAVLISHSHYDHLDINTVTLLNARFGVDLRWFVPQGLLSWFEAAGCENVVELDWWEENCVPEKGEVSFTFVPSQHWSKRTLNDDNKSLWGGWVVCGPNHRFYFAGDTGYCPVFKQIGRMFGPITASAIPIGAYEPRWFMRSQHVNPEEAVQIHEDVRSKFTIGIHWGTFALANEYYLDPPVKLREALDAKSLNPDSFITFKHGETRLVAQNGMSSSVKSTRRKQR